MAGENTRVKRAKVGSKKERRVEEVQTEEEVKELPPLFVFKESKYHDDILNREPRNK